MRELRAWIEIENQMFYQGEMFLDSFLRRVKLRAFGHLPNYSTYGFPPLTQFTGLLDINGNKIFENDTVKYTYEVTEFEGTIVYEDKLARYVVKDKDGKFLNYGYCTFYELTGNIYEKRN